MIVELSALVLILAFTSAGWSYFIEYIITPNQIFGRYGIWINQMAGNLPVSESDKFDYEAGGKKYLNPRSWANPLGACINCMNFYVTVIWSIIGLSYLGQSYWLILAILPISHYFVRKVMVG